MKKRTLFLMVILGFIVVSTCSCALFRSEKQYEKGEWFGATTSAEVVQIKIDKLALESRKLALEKLKNSQPIISEEKSQQGYLGLVANLSSSRRANIIIKGPETKSYLLAQGQIQEDYLLPGPYEAIKTENGSVVGRSWKFSVGLHQFFYMGKKVHWYIYVE